MGIIEVKVKCIRCEKEIEVEVKISNIDTILRDKRDKYNNCRIVNAMNGKEANILCDDCIACY